MSIVASALLVGVTTAVFAGGTPVAAQTAGGVPFGTADFGGYSTGSVIHADAINAGTTRVADVEVAFSGASVASKGLTPRQVNEVDQVVVPEDKGRESFARGSGLELGVTTSTPTVDNTVILSQKATASANPATRSPAAPVPSDNDTGLVNAEVGPVNLNPVAYASLLRGQAQARWEDNRCVVGEPISKGLGYAADAELVNLGGAGEDGSFQSPLVAADIPAGTPAGSPDRSVSQSQSTTRLVPNPNGSGSFGFETETRMTIAPVTLLAGTPSPITIEFLGEWVLRATAYGTGAGSATIHYGPGTATPSTPVLRVLQGPLAPLEVTLQQLLGPTGLALNVPGVLDLAIGEDPRAIGNPPDSASSPVIAGDGTSASAAVDVVRVRLLDDAAVLGLGLADLRIGHMEATARVPVGGIRCQLPVSKSADPDPVRAGNTFIYSITVTNPFADCELTNVRVEDNITVTPGVRYSITGTNPAASSQTANQVVWNDIGPIGPKQSKTVTISIAIPANSAAGLFTNNAKATGNCATGGAQGGARITVPITGETTVTVPRVEAVRAAELPATDISVLPRTGSSGPAMALTGLALLGAALGLRRFRAHSVR